MDGLPELPMVAVCAVGLMGDQADNAADMTRAAVILRSNFEGPASILGVLANKMEARGSGTLVGISRSRANAGGHQTMFYGSAKAGFTAHLSGLRNRLAKRACMS